MLTRQGGWSVWASFLSLLWETEQRPVTRLHADRTSAGRGRAAGSGTEPPPSLKGIF